MLGPCFVVEFFVSFLVLLRNNSWLLCFDLIVLLLSCGCLLCVFSPLCCGFGLECGM